MSTINSKKYVLVISHVMPVPPAAGNEIRILKILQFLKSNGFSVIYLLNQKLASQDAVLELKNYVDEIYLNNIDSNIIDGKIVSSSIEFLSDKNEVKKSLCPPDLVFLSSVLSEKYNPVAVISEYIFTSPCMDVVSQKSLKIIDAHDMFSKRKEGEELFVTLEEERNYSLKADVIMAINLEAVLFSKNVPERKIISVGIDYDFEKSAVKNNVIPNSVFVIGSDNAENIKGINEFCLNVWSQVKKSVPNAQLRIAGKMSSKLNISDPSIKLLGIVEDLEKEYRNAAIVINSTSFGTGLKIKTVEALCHGKAFVGTENSVEGLPVSEQKPFIVCKNWNSFAESIISLFKSNSNRQELEKSALLYAKQHFTKEVVYQPLLEMLNQHLTNLEESKNVCPVCKSGKFVRYGNYQWNIWDEEYHLVRCVECESIFTDPIPSDETLKKLYATGFDYRWYQDHYGAKLLDCQNRVAEYKEYLGKRVLDFGGGLGYFSQVARSAGYESITYDPYVENKQIPNKDWDTIVSLHVLEHSNNLDHTLSLIKDCLTQGGNLILVVPNAKSEGYKKLDMNWVWAQPPLLHLFHFTAKGLKALLQRNGFNIQNISYHERWDANLYTDLEKVEEYQKFDLEWGSKEINSDPAKRALIAWRNSTMRVNGLEKALENYDLTNDRYAELQINAVYGHKNFYKIGLINKDFENNYEKGIICFQISKYELSFTQIFYSSFATPARYIMEMYVRLYSIREANDNIVVFNPFFLTSNKTARRVKSEIDKIRDCSEILIFSDKNEVPVAYVFPNNLPFYDIRYLSFLSAMYSELDAAFLRNIFLIKSRCIYLKDIALEKYNDNNGFFYNNDYERLYSWITDSALKTLNKKFRRLFSNDNIDLLNADDIKVLNALKHQIPCTVIMPHHAGDALFLAMALKNSISFINKIVISDWYKDIIEDYVPEITTYPINITPWIRDKNYKPEEVLFWRSLQN